MALPERPLKSSGDMAPNHPWTDPEFASDYPSLFSFLNDATYDNGQSRLTGGISIFVKFMVLTAAVNDHARGAVAYVNATTWAELLFLIDAGIKDDSLAWKRKTAFVQTKNPPF